MGALAVALPYISAAASAVGMVTSLAGAKQGADAAKAQAAQYEDERRTAQTAALQEETERRRELSSVLATQQAVRAGRRLELYSATFQNMQDVTVRAAEDDIDNIRLNALNRQRRLGFGIDQADAQGRGAWASGAGGALAGLGGAAGKWPQDKKPEGEEA